MATSDELSVTERSGAPGAIGPGAAGVSSARRRWRPWTRWLVLLLVLAVGAVLGQVVHDHGSDAHSDDDARAHHCPLCHVQQTVFEPLTAAELSPRAVPRDRVAADPRESPRSAASRWAPPLRGPPLS